MQNVVCLYKKLGQTPLEAVEEFRSQNPESKNIKLGYAGRLDPMAEGLLLVLVGEENKNRKSYERLPKEYEFEVLFGVSTDSYDLLGLVNELRIKNYELRTEEITNVTKQFVGKWKQEYPPYSAVRVNGKPLYYWAREGKLDTIKIPKKEIEIYSVELLAFRSISTREFEQDVFERIGRINGEFRQKEILGRWREFFEKNVIKEFQVVKFRISCSSGTYIRSIANDFGKKLGVSTLAYSIRRTKIGEFFCLTQS